jgi:hypothetical protein
MERPLFVYGSLIVPEVVLALLDRVPRSQDAALSGWAARCLPGVAYPGLVPDERGVARGLILHDLTTGEAALIDAWETDVYEKRLVHPSLEGGSSIAADAYVLGGHRVDEADAKAWTVDVLSPELDDFCADTRSFRRAWLSERGKTDRR